MVVSIVFIYDSVKIATFCRQGNRFREDKPFTGNHVTVRQQIKILACPTLESTHLTIMLYKKLSEEKTGGSLELPSCFSEPRGLCPNKGIFSTLKSQGLVGRKR